MTGLKTFRRCGARAMPGGAALAILAGLSAGCTSIATSDVDPQYFDHARRHPIMLSEEPEKFELPVGMNGPAVSPEIEQAVRNYVAEYQRNGTGAITIQVPTASANEIAAASTGHAVHYALARAGVPHGQIKIAPYHVGDHSKVAALQLSYLRVKAVAPRCGIWPEVQPNRFDNAQYHNLGCAAQQNLAAMVANPADLVYPQPMTPANGKRRAHVIQIYTDTGNTGWNPVPLTTLIDTEVESF